MTPAIPQRYGVDEILQVPVKNQDKVIGALSNGDAELVGGYKALEQLGRLAVRSRNSDMLERSRFLCAVALAQNEAWRSRKRLIARPLVYLALKSGHLMELEAYALVTRAAASVDLEEPAAAERDLARYFALALKQVTSEILNPYAQELLAIARARQQHWVAAQDAAEDAVRSARRRKDRKRLGRALLMLSEAVLRNGKVEQAIESLQEAESIGVESQDVGMRGDAYQVRAKITAAQGRYVDALDYASLAQDAYAKVEAHRSIADVGLLVTEIQRVLDSQSE